MRRSPRARGRPTRMSASSSTDTVARCKLSGINSTRAGDVEGAHRILRQGGHISEAWRRSDGGAEERLRLLLAEGAWDDARGRARKDRYRDAVSLRPLALARIVQ